MVVSEEGKWPNPDNWTPLIYKKSGITVIGPARSNKIINIGFEIKII